jgi:hypothetical protein
MATPFDNLTIAKAQERVGAAVQPGEEKNRLFYDGDHWQGGSGWIGPLPDPSEANAAQVRLDIERGFVGENKVREVVQRHLNGAVGHTPQWTLGVRRALAEGEGPTEQEQALIAEGEALLRQWWDWRGTHNVVKDAVVDLLLAGRVPLRLFVPAGELNEQGQIPRAEPDEAIWYVYAEALKPAEATVFTDRRTMQDCGVYVYEDESSSTTMAELSYLDGEETVLRIVSNDSKTETRMPLDEALQIYEMRREALIGEQVRQQQKLLNLAKSMEARNVVVGGFLERVLLNAQLPGRWELDEQTGRETFVPGAFRIGAGTTNFLAGVPIVDAEGNTTGYANPDVVYRDPVPVDTFEATALSAYRSILEEAHQVHALIAGDATPSGESRRQAVFDFAMSLMDTAEAVERAVRWLLETTLALAAHFAGQSGRYDELRASVTCRIDVGPISAEEMKALVEVVGARLMSQRTAMARLGIDDPAAEEQQIEQEQEQQRQQARMSLGEAMLQFDRGEGEDERA